MSEHEREMTYLRQIIAPDEVAECHEVEEKITRAERAERCVRRAVWLMAVLAALAAAGLGYAAVLLQDYPQNLPRFFAHFVVETCCALGLASLVSLLSFVGVWAVCRKHMAERREDCRRLATKVLASRLRSAATLSVSGLFKE